MWQMRRDDAKAQAATGQNALVVQGYFDQLKRENNAFWELTPEQKARAEERRLQLEKMEQDRRNALTPAEREAEDKEREREKKKAERAAARRKGPRARTIPWGVGSSAGMAAGDRVQLRKEIQ
jgi:hypothetical protein